MPMNLVWFLAAGLAILAALFLDPVRKLVAVVVVLAMICAVVLFWATGEFEPFGGSPGPALTHVTTPGSW